MIEETKVLLKNADSILIFAGAGMSADSNLPTYRDKDGFWNNYPLYKSLKKDYMSITTSNAFRNDPKFAWGFYGHIYKLYKEAKPHRGYIGLKKFLQDHDKNFFVITSNVDGLFLKTGYNSELVHEVHGVVRKFQCSTPCKRVVWEPNSYEFNIDYTTMKASKLPNCPDCKSIARPNIFMFDDSDKTYVWEEALKGGKRFQNWIGEFSKINLVILLLGVGEQGLKSHAQQYANICKNVKIISINLVESDFEKNNPKIIMLKGNAEDILIKLLK